MSDLATQLHEYGRYLREELPPVALDGVQAVGRRLDNQEPAPKWRGAAAVVLGVLALFAIRLAIPIAPADVAVPQSTTQQTAPSSDGRAVVDTSFGDLVWVEALPDSPQPLAESVTGLFAVENGIGYQSSNGLDWAELGAVSGDAGDQYVWVDRPGDLYRIPAASICKVVCEDTVTIQRSIDGGIHWTSTFLENSRLSLVTETARLYSNGASFVLAVGAGVRCGREEFWTSTDGEEWTYLIRPWEACNLSEVLVAAGKRYFFYQLGEDGVFSAWQSPDGFDWERGTVQGLDGVGVPTFGYHFVPEGKNCLCEHVEIAFSEGRFLAWLNGFSSTPGVRSTLVYQSEDGISFTELGESPVRYGQPFGDGWMRYGPKHLEVSVDGTLWDEVLTLDPDPESTTFSPDLSGVTPSVWSDLITLSKGSRIAWVGSIEAR